jgi:hypothetical protein
MNFNDPANINMLWEILMDAEGPFIMKNNGQYVDPIRKQFSNITRNFYEVEKTSGLSLIALNKKIITVLMNEWMPMLKKQEQEMQTPKVEPVLFTAEEIQKSRKTEFEQQFNEKQNEFKTAMAQPVPSTIDFNEKKDEPIGEMEKLIAETIAQRNFEINQLQNPNKEEAEKWLQSVKTTPNKEPQGIKYIKIGEPISNKPEPIVELPSPKKQLSWAPQLEEDDDNYNNIQLNVSDSIFSKLKPLQDSNLDIKTLNGKMETLIDKMDILIDLFTKNANK